VIETGAVGDEQSVIIRIGRQQIRTKETLDLLMRAAQSIPVRDSYEGADSDDIAELAGRTKVQSMDISRAKEVIALIACHRQQHREKLRQSFTIELVRRFFMDLADDKDWALLQLEFKMFTLRHPEAKEPYKRLNLPSNFSREAEYARIIGGAGKRKGSVSRVLALNAVFPYAAALLLEAELILNS
jgi:hypothetical protein